MYMVISKPKRMSVALGVDHFIVFSLNDILGDVLVCISIVWQNLGKSHPYSHDSWLQIFCRCLAYSGSVILLGSEHNGRQPRQHMLIEVM